jgi:hypothetical protein
MNIEQTMKRYPSPGSDPSHIPASVEKDPPIPMILATFFLKGSDPGRLFISRHCWERSREVEA